MPDFAWPWVFACLPLPYLCWRYLRPLAPMQALRLPHPELALHERRGKSSHGVRLWLLVAAWLCLLAAAARPQWLGPPQPQQHSGRALMMAVDLSASMQTSDMELGGQSISRFAAVESIAGDFISRRKSDELGLIVFGSRAFLVTPLTYDLAAVRAQLRGVVVGLAGSQTAIGDAIAVAVKHLSALPGKSRALILLTDGVNNTGRIRPLQAARAAKAAHVRIYTIGIGATRMRVAGFFGDRLINPSADLDTGMLRNIAQITGGHFYRATDSQQLAKAYRAIDALEPIAQHGPSVRLHHELFRWPLLASVLLLLLAWGLSWWEPSQ